MGLSGFVWVCLGAERTTKSPHHLSSPMIYCGENELKTRIGQKLKLICQFMLIQVELLRQTPAESNLMWTVFF